MSSRVTVRDVPCHVSQESVPPMFEHKKLKTVGKGAGWVRMECRRRGMACEKRIGDTWATNCCVLTMKHVTFVTIERDATFQMR